MAQFNGLLSSCCDLLITKYSTADQQLGPRALVVFFRLQRFYKTFNVVSALVSGLSLAVLTFNEFHPTTSGQSEAAEGFLVSSAVTSVISIMLATMLLFRYEGFETATRKDLALVWVPLIALDWAIVAFVVGLLLWYGEKNDMWRTTIIGLQTGALLAFVCWAAVWMWSTMSRKGGLGKAESEPSEGKRRVANT